jgi:hypothetical protein
MGNIATVHVIYQALGRGDVPAIIDHLDPKNGRVTAFWHFADTHQHFMASRA